MYTNAFMLYSHTPSCINRPSACMCAPHVLSCAHTAFTQPSCILQRLCLSMCYRRPTTSGPALLMVMSDQVSKPQDIGKWLLHWASPTSRECDILNKREAEPGNAIPCGKLDLCMPAWRPLRWLLAALSVRLRLTGWDVLPRVRCADSSSCSWAVSMMSLF